MREIVITEKIDGTNAQINVLDDGRVLAGSRSKWITPADDNFGFARWVKEHEDELRTGLGFGRHVGEWWGAGIQRRYDLKEKRFSLFNVKQWAEPPPLCHVVPVLYSGLFSDWAIQDAIDRLRLGGSVAAPGFMKPEGVCVFHTAAMAYFKRTIEDDERPKSVIASKRGASA